MIAAQLLFRGCHELAEGPVWYEGALWWVDIEGRRLSRGDVESCAVIEMPLPCRVGAMVPCGGGRWLTANEYGFGFFDEASGFLENLGCVLLLSAGLRMNDGKCDPRGRFVAGTMHEDLDTGKAKLYSVDETLDPQVLLVGLTLSNGLGWSPDGLKFYHIDTAQRRIDVYDYDLEVGIPANRRALAHIPKYDGWPDGMAVDQEGNLWVALWGGAAVICYDGRNGQIVDRIACPVTQPSSCCFGGAGMDQLFITSARQGLTEAQLNGRDLLAGSVFVARPGPVGLPVNFFGLRSNRHENHRSQSLAGRRCQVQLDHDQGLYG
jgi:sugar lactone lactonase YvrE